MMKKLYIIDDDQDFLDIVSYILGKNYKVVTTNALKLDEVASYKPDLILMDNSVGTDMSEKMIRQLNIAFPSFSTPIILVSAHHDISRLAGAKGINGFIQKPSSIGYIRSYVNEFFQKDTDEKKLA